MKLIAASGEKFAAGSVNGQFDFDLSIADLEKLVPDSPALSHSVDKTGVLENALWSAHYEGFQFDERTECFVDIRKMK